jgi:hypothetical protein
VLGKGSFLVTISSTQLLEQIGRKLKHFVFVFSAQVIDECTP